MITKMLSLFLLLLTPTSIYAACTGSSPTWTCSADSTTAQIQTCINSASPGDTINIGAGSGTWNAIDINKGINLIGAGIGNTVITRGTGSYMINYVVSSGNLSSNTPFRFSGFSVNGDAGTIIWLGPDASAGVSVPYTPQTNIRIDHNRFYLTTGNSDNQVMLYRGAYYGAVDNNTIDGYSYVFRNINTSGTYDWYDNAETDGFGWAFGDSYKLYFEDNTINFGYDSGFPYNVVSDSQYAGRYAFRYNTFNIDANSQCWPLFDLHGYQTSGTLISSFGAELYGNKVVGSVGDFYQTRGGSSVVFFNQFPSSGWSVQTSNSLVTCPSSYAEEQMIHDSYYWQNRMGASGSLVPITVSGTLTCTGRTRPVRGIDVFDNTSSPAISAGTLANRPANPSTVGQAYWETSQSTTNLTGMTGVNPTTPISGTLYYTTNGTSWNKSFTPYTYPHPLREEVDPDVTAPTISGVSGVGFSLH